MPKISDKMREWKNNNPNKPFFSFEYFPPKTETGLLNLYDRFDRMAVVNPMWIDVTWGAGGSTADSTLEICKNALKYHGLDPLMHLTCTNMELSMIDRALKEAKDAGIQNILALRGDPPKDQERWTAVDGGFEHALDLVKYIRQQYGDYFCIAVAGYPEGHLENPNKEDDLQNLKKKIDAGADFVITQLFYDVEEFLHFIDRARKIGITVPILPGIMPIQSYAGFKRMTGFCKTKVPQKLMDELEAVKDDEQAVKDLGVRLGVEMCKEIADSGLCPGLHFYTLNLEVSVMRIIDGLQLVDDHQATRALPWRPSAHPGRVKEEVRPIFWANRPKSYVHRTNGWDDFPNGRWGSIHSPAFGEAFWSASIDPEQTSMEKRRQMWGKNPTKIEDLQAVFIKFLRGEGVTRLPWCAESVSDETNMLKKQLVRLNQRGCLTINSQPRVNGAISTDPYFGWGPKGGLVYQKAYVEFFCSPETLSRIIFTLDKHNELRGFSVFSYAAVNRQGHVRANVKEECANAVTWGVFPGEEIKQPTVVDLGSFMIWKDEAFALWEKEWGCIYEEGSAPRRLVQCVEDTFFLVNIVDNDFVSGDLFGLLCNM